MGGAITETVYTGLEPLMHVCLSLSLVFSQVVPREHLSSLELSSENSGRRHSAQGPSSVLLTTVCLRWRERTSGDSKGEVCFPLDTLCRKHGTVWSFWGFGGFFVCLFALLFLFCLRWPYS